MVNIVRAGLRIGQVDWHGRTEPPSTTSSGVRVLSGRAQFALRAVTALLARRSM
jgi:hypothetical protein